MKIITWNTNGFFLEKTRLEVLTKLSEEYKMGNKSNSIFCLQEAGTPQTLRGLTKVQLGTIDYSVIHYIPYQTERSRCSLVFLVPKSIMSKFNSFAFDSEQESRPVACLLNVKSSFIIANIHATPGRFDDTPAARDVISTVLKLEKTSFKWALWGDMNCEPDKLKEFFDANIKNWSAMYTIIPPKECTHQCNKKLDYSITNSRCKIEISFDKVRHYQASDHRPVVFNINDSFLLGNH